ncbi:MAG: VRR-NUC domain-containing protein [Planctomycetota bacterium]
MSCKHENVACLNEFENVRKYRCDDCAAVMMCACDRDIGERFLPHQLREGCVLETQERVPVTLGFVDGVCRECRGLPPEAHPRAEIHGQTSKIRRYYWREITFEVYRRFADRAESAGHDPKALWAPEAEELRKEVEREVLAEIKELHATAPKYEFSEPSQAEILAEHEVEEVRIDATFAPKSEGKGAGIVDGDEMVSAEEFVTRHYERQGWTVLRCESRPFHVLFGIYLWLLIQDNADPLVKIQGFGAKMDHPSLALGKGDLLWTGKPTDFGTSGYAERRAAAIDEHFDSLLPPDRDELLWLFDYWIEGSALLRDYLWAHDPGDVDKARTIVEVLPPEVLLRILRYLVGNYWGRYLGWPDLLVYRDGRFFLAEVKASKDKLSADQKRWIADNATELQLPFKLVKIHRVATSK